MASIVTTAVTDSTDTTIYRADGMSCEHCRVAVTSEVARVDGVRGVEVDLDAKLIRVQGDDVDPVSVVLAIDEAGYDAERVA